MAGWDDVTTFDALAAMSPAERVAHFDACVVWDLDELPEAYRRRIEEQNARVLAREERLRGRAS